MEFPDVFEAKSPPQWATFCPDRRPDFKVHTNLGLARSAIADKKPNREVALYHLEVNEQGQAYWMKTWEYVFPEICPECGGSFATSRYGRHLYTYNTPYAWQGIIQDAPVICEKCFGKQRQAHNAAARRARELKELQTLRSKYPNN